MLSQNHSGCNAKTRGELNDLVLQTNRQRIKHLKREFQAAGTQDALSGARQYPMPLHFAGRLSLSH